MEQAHSGSTFQLLRNLRGLRSILTARFGKDGRFFLASLSWSLIFAT
jgi:hypothetical protein